MNPDYDCLNKICQRRKSIRRFKDKKISESDLEKIKQHLYVPMMS